jgi:hypothetical protein
MGFFTTNLQRRLIFYLWPVPWALGIAAKFSGSWVSDAAFAAAAALVGAALVTLWAAFRRSRRR